MRELGVNAARVMRGVRRVASSAAATASAAALVATAPLAPGGAAAAQVPLLQTLDNRQNPRGIDWRRIETPHFEVIYPDALGKEAQRAATLLEATYAPLRRTLGKGTARFPVVLNNRSLSSNAYVAWGPRRSQWYALPPTTVDAMGPVEWYTLLAAHEGRHVVQQEAVRSGLVGVADRLFGDNTTAFLGGALYFPSWFWEGDAVGMETALTGSGRGRQPSFTQRIRALRSAGKPYRYWPAWEGTYRTYLPDWYELGFVITTHVRRRYGPDAWREVIRRAARNPLAPMALSMALRRVTGRTLEQLHGDAIAELDTLWVRQRGEVEETPARLVTPADTGYHQWLTPQFAGDGSVIATYSDLSTVKRLERLREGKREVLVRDIALPGELQFHVSRDRVVWSEYEQSPRWGEESFLVVKRLDLATGKLTRLTDRSRYFAPTLSPDARRVAVIDFSLARRAEAVVLDAESGRELQRLANTSGHFLVTPSWSPDGASLYVVAVSNGRGNALVRMPLDGSATDTILPFTHAAISRPVAVGGRIVFGSPRSGIDNLYVVDTATRAVAAVTSRRFGAMWGTPSPDGSRLLFSDYSVRGYDIAEMALDGGRLDSLLRIANGTSGLPAPTGYAEPLVAQEGGGDAAAQAGRGGGAGDRVWTSAPYRGVARLLDFHSLALSPTTDAANTGLTLESRNLLNTFGVSVGGAFNLNERTAAAEVGASYAALPVIVDVAGRLGRRASTYSDSAGGETGFSWQEQSLNVALRLPLSRLVGLTRQSVVASVGMGVTRISDQPVAFRFENNNGRFTPLTYLLSASHFGPAAYRDLYPTGAAATALYRHTPLGSDYRSHQASVRGSLYLPGVADNDAVVLDAALEAQTPGNYRFSSQYLFPRGYASRFHERFVRAGVSYHHPLLYPDLALGPWLYVRRVQGAAFADAGRGSARSGAAARDYRSVGGELTADVSPFGLRQTIRTGVRVSRTLTGEKRASAEWIVSIF